MVTAIGTVNLLIAWACILFFSVPLIVWTNKTALTSGIIAKQDLENEDESGGFFSNFTYCWNIPLIRTLAYISIPLCWVYYILDYQFFIALNEIYKEQDHLTAFLGIFNSVVSLNGLILQLFITGMILRKIGVGSSVLFHPIGVVLGSIALTIRNFLPVSPSPKLFSYRGLSAVFAKYSDVAIAYSIGESASHLLYNSIPEEKRGRSRAFISGTMEPIGTLTGSSLLILFGIIHLSLQIIALITVGLSVVWVVLSLRLKKEYIRELVENLSSNDISLRTSAMSELSKMKDSNTIQVLLEAVSSKSEEVSLFALEILKGINDVKIVAELCKILTVKNPKMQTAILSLLAEIEAKHAVPAIRPLLHDSEPEVQAAAVRTLEKLDGAEDLPLLDELLEHGALAVRVEVIIMYIRRQPDLDRTVRAIEILKELVKNKQDSAARAKAAYIIGELRVTQLRYILIDLAATPDEMVQPEAIRSLGHIGDEKIIPLLLQLLPNSSSTENIKVALINLGNTNIELLHNELRSDKHTKKIKADIIYCLGKIGNPESIPVLEKYIGEQPTCIEDGVIESLGAIKENILQKLVENNQEELKRYFRESILKRLVGYLSATVHQLRKVHMYINCLTKGSRH
ncbi:MAG: HEAT repeat domain-containing protein [Patescibacteria group bacterium]|nr:HEAT repeat domain-containing protein [Patescibacteria group bacterium]